MSPRRLTIEECHDLAFKNNGRCLSEIYKDNRTKMLWECKAGHKWEQKFAHIKSGHWCPICARKENSKKQVLSDGLQKAQRMAKLKNGKCISKKYINTHSLMKWKCRNSHTWSASFANVRAGTWCPYCAGQVITLDDCKKLAKSNNGECLSGIYKNAHKKLQWKCKCGHIWAATYNDIRQGKWCPACASGKTQRKIFEIVKEIFCKHDVFYNFTGFEWLRTKKGRKQEIDVFVAGAVKLAIEYDGEQHFYPVRWTKKMSLSSAQEIFKRIVELDQEKNNKILGNPEDVRFFIRISYLDKIDRQFLLEKIKDAVRSDTFLFVSLDEVWKNEQKRK